MKHFCFRLFFANIFLICSIPIHAQLQSTWELLRTHEVVFEEDSGIITMNIDTNIYESPENVFFNFQADTVFMYDLDYEDSKERNCYMLWAEPYITTDDSIIQYTDYPAVTNSTLQTWNSFHIQNDTLLYSELWLEDAPSWIYHQAKYFYFIKRSSNTILPPSFWPTTECHSQSNIIHQVHYNTNNSTSNLSKSLFNIQGQILKGYYSHQMLIDKTKHANIFINSK